MSSIYVLTPLSKKVSEWINDNVEIDPGQRLRYSLVFEDRQVDPIIKSLMGNGFEIGVDFRLTD